MRKIGNKSEKILGACIGECIHVAGLLKFLTLAETIGFDIEFLPPPTSMYQLLLAIKNSKASIIALSYRLTPENGKAVLTKLIENLSSDQIDHRKFYLGCLPELAEFAQTLHFFDQIFVGGETPEQILPILKPHLKNTPFYEEIQYPQSLLPRIALKKPYPLIRVHFGLPKLSDTILGIQTLAKSSLVDIISIAPDQTAQEFFHRFDPERKYSIGAGGVPLRKSEDLLELKSISREGNYPLLRIYSGTQDLIKNAELFDQTIQNAWAAIPLFWYSELDGRSSRTLIEAISENFFAIQWYASRNMCVEINDPHQWGLRYASDAIVVADAYLSAKIAKELGVHHYIQQLMFNTPAGVDPKKDLARVLAMIEISQELVDSSFEIIRETRTGLSHLSINPTIAKGQLCASTQIQLSVHPDIIHIVSFCEGNHAATVEDIIESCLLVQPIILDGIKSPFLFSEDSIIQTRKNSVIHDAKLIIDTIKELGYKLGILDRFASPQLLEMVVKTGIFDAPHLKNSPIARGTLKTAIIEGECLCIDQFNNILDEKDRLFALNVASSLPILMKNSQNQTEEEILSYEVH